MQINGAESLAEYLMFLRVHPGESGALLQDMLISVTNFFRDRDAFKVLEAHIPELFAGKGPGDQLRVWVPACATGEEGLLGGHAPLRARPRVADAAALAGLRHRPGRGGRPVGARWRLPRRHHHRRERGAARALLRQGTPRLPRAPRTARDRALRPARPAQGLPLFQARSHHLPQPAHLPGPRRAETRAGHLPLRAATGRTPLPRHFGERGRRQRTLRAARQEAPPLHRAVDREDRRAGARGRRRPGARAARAPARRRTSRAPTAGGEGVAALAGGGTRGRTGSGRRGLSAHPGAGRTGQHDR